MHQNEDEGCFQPLRRRNTEEEFYFVPESEKYGDGETLNSISGSRSRGGKPTLKELH